MFLFDTQKRNLSPSLHKKLKARAELNSFLNKNGFYFVYKDNYYIIKHLNKKKNISIGATKIDAFIKLIIKHNFFFQKELCSHDHINLLELENKDTYSIFSEIYPYIEINKLSYKKHYNLLTQLNNKGESMLGHYINKNKSIYIPVKYHNIYIPQWNLNVKTYLKSKVKK